MDTYSLRGYDYCVDPRDVDFRQRATLMAVGDYILDAAGKDADVSGFGVRDLNEDNASWVLSRMSMEFDRLPEEYEKIRISTWVSDISRVMTTRNLIMTDARGLRIGAAVTNWAMIDLSRRRARDLGDFPLYWGFIQHVPPPVELPRRLASLKEAEHVCDHRVVYSDLDFNCHANSMKYLQWVIDTFPLESLAQRASGRIDINFIQEARYGETMSIFSVSSESGVSFEIRNEGGVAVCRICFSAGESMSKLRQS